MQPPILTVFQLTNALKQCIESTFPLVWVQGEVSNLKVQTSGHLYFTLKDAQAQISAVMFKGNAASLPLMPKGGDQILVKGELNVYPPKGNYQIIVRELSHVGLGELLLKLEQLKLKLHALGWFSRKHKKPLPKLPRRIGIVTSPTGAVIQDILHVLTRRFAEVPILLNPVRVQGEGAAQEIAQAIDQFNHYQMVDVIIIGRGGGSLEDLWAFNEEVVAEAIWRSQIPIISAVGHETDHCIADYVADVRAPTPSAAAEIVIGEKAHLVQHLEQTEKRLIYTLRHLLLEGRQRLKNYQRQPAFASPYHFLGVWMQKLDDFREDFDRAIQQLHQRKRLQLHAYERQAQALKPTLRIQQLKKTFQEMEKQLQRGWQRKLLSSREQLAYLHATLQAIDPKNLLSKGYSILFDEKTHSVINSIQSLHEDQTIQLLLADGKATARVITLNN